jgi:hypothetical protein
MNEMSWPRNGDDPQAFDYHVDRRSRRRKFGVRRLYHPGSKNLAWRTQIKAERREG